jgi:hypothetical protein
MDSKILTTKAKIKTPVLDKIYARHINNVLHNLSEEDEARWEFYSIIIQELYNTNNDIFINEIKYRITDGETTNDVFLNILQKLNNEELWFIKKRLEEFEDEDFFKRFF